MIALVLLGAAVAGAGAPATASAGGGLTAVQIGGVSVLANARGLTLYWFAPDTPTRSVCNGSCAAYWPPVKGPVTAGPGVTGRLGTIKRSDGSAQATYDGHPLYTYVGDSAPGQAHGNNLNLNGGLWHEVTTAGEPRSRHGASAAADLTERGQHDQDDRGPGEEPVPDHHRQREIPFRRDGYPPGPPRTAAASWARYTRIQRAPMVRPRAATTTRVRAAA